MAVLGNSGARYTMLYKRNTLLNNKKYVLMLLMTKESLPRRYFTKGDRKLVGFRLPIELKEKIESLANELGWTVTDVAQTALDNYVYDEISKIESQRIENKKSKERGRNNENSKKRS